MAGEARFTLAPLALADAGPAGSPAVQLFAEPRVLRGRARRRCSAGYVSKDARDARQLYPEDERLQHLSDEARAVVSEPLADLPGRRREVPPSSAVIMQLGDDQEVPFTAHAPD